MPFIRGNLKTVKDVTDARNVLKQIANNPKFTEYGAKRLVKWHKKLTSLAFAQKKNPDTSEPWAGAEPKTEHDKRFKGLLTQSGDLLKSATNPDVSIKTKEGTTTATIKMPGTPFYAEFHQFGTSNIHKNSAAVFQNHKTKKVETSYKRSTRTPARPFFAFASDNFSEGSETAKEIEKTTTVVFKAISKSILKRAVELPTADIDGYTSSVSFYTNGAALTNRVAKSGRTVSAKNKDGVLRHARLDARPIGHLYSAKGYSFSTELTESLKPPPVVRQSAQSARHEHYREVHRQSMLYRSSTGIDGEVIAARHRREVHESRNAGRGEAINNLDIYNEKYNNLWARINKTTDPGIRAQLELELAEMRITFALETGAVFRESERASQGGGREALNDLVTRHKQHMEAIRARIEASKEEATKERHRKALQQEQERARQAYLNLPGKREEEPFRFESALNSGELAAQAQRREHTKWVHDKLTLNVGGRPAMSQEHKNATHARYLQKRRDEYQAGAEKRREERLKEEAVRAGKTTEQLKAEQEAAQQKIQDQLVKHKAGKSVVVKRELVGPFYESVTDNLKELANANKMVQSARRAARQGKLPQDIADLHQYKYDVMRNRIRKQRRRNADQTRVIRPARSMNAPEAETTALATTKSTAAPKGATPKNTQPRPPGPPKGTNAAPKTPSAAGPKKAAAPAGNTLSAAEKAHNKAVRAQITEIEATKKQLEDAGNTEGVAFLEKKSAALKSTLHEEGAAPAAPKYNAAQKTVLPHLERRIKQLKNRANILSKSVDELRAERNEVRAKGYHDLANDLDALAVRRHNRVSLIHQRLIPDLLRSFEKLSEDALVKARAKANPGHLNSNVTAKPKE